MQYRYITRSIVLKCFCNIISTSPQPSYCVMSAAPAAIYRGIGVAITTGVAGCVGHTDADAQPATGFVSICTVPAITSPGARRGMSGSNGIGGTTHAWSTCGWVAFLEARRAGASVRRVSTPPIPKFRWHARRLPNENAAQASIICTRYVNICQYTT